MTQGKLTSPKGGKSTQDAINGLIDDVAGKQDTLVSGTTIKTINNESILGSGNLTISASAPSNMVTTDTTQNITGVKTFVGDKRIKFKQSSSSDKLGFTLYNNSGYELGMFEYNPSNTVDNSPLFVLGTVNQTNAKPYLGFRYKDNPNNAYYNLLAPRATDAKTPFSLSTTFTNFYMPLGFTNGATTVTTSNTGMVDLSSLITGGGGTATDVQINGTSITNNNVANIVTNTAYNSSSNKIATMSDVPTITFREWS